MGNYSSAMLIHNSTSRSIRYLQYARENLGDAEYVKVKNVYNKVFKMITLYVIAISLLILLPGAIIIPDLSDYSINKLLSAYDATRYESVVRVNSSTVQYTKGESYQFNVAELGYDLDRDFPNQKSLVIILDDNDKLKGVVTNDEFNKTNDISIISLISMFTLCITLLICFYIYMSKYNKHGKVWYSFRRWVDKDDKRFLKIIEEYNY